MQQRKLGNTEDSLSLIGLGGVVFVGLTQIESNNIVAESVDGGVNYFDVAPSYGQGQETEIKLGEALKPYRDQSFLACKTGVRTKDGANAELERSLRYLQTDHVDLYQLHAITSREDVETAFGPDGAMEAIVTAQQAGKIRHIGFSAHSVEAALLALDKFPFASALFPINVVTWNAGSFGPQILDAAKSRGAGRLALKAMAKTHWAEGMERNYPNCWYEPIEDIALSELALRWTLSQDITAAVPPGDIRLYRRALEFAGRFTPLTEAEEAILMEKTKDFKPLFSQDN
jgi:aryl-alcohol dehydrogenase-like predicted oxidoreductase